MTQLASAVDRAEKYRLAGESRIDIDRFGYLECNRGGLGISPPHAHEVCEDRMKNKTRIARYVAVKAVILEGDFLIKTRAANEEKCRGDPLMPNYSPKMDLGLLKLTHFVHSQKLFKDGCRTLYNLGAVKIKLQDDDEEGKAMMEYGPLTILYSSGLLKDEEALNALMREDNENATINLKEDTMVTYGSIDRIITSLVKSAQPGSQPLTDVECLKACKAVLQEARFTEEMLLTLIRFRGRLSVVVSEVFSGHVSN